MPKIRDLGINVIPATMRPPEIGPGGYYMNQQGEDGEADCTLATCMDRSLHHCDSPSPGPGEGCVATPQDKPNCPPPSPNCPHHTKQHNAEASGLTPGAIEQLRQQMRTELHP